MARAKGVTAAQLAIAWVLRLPEVFAVAKTSTRARAVENRAALEIDLSADELERLDAMFPPPFRKVPLDMI
jgi:diketogulonate reductase-like aldo/keto reductase